MADRVAHFHLIGRFMKSEVSNMKRIAAVLFLLITTTVANAQSATPAWKLELTTRLSPTNDRYSQLCGTEKCNRQRQEFVAKLLKVCLYRDKSTQGLFSRGAWKAVVSPGEEGRCQEVFFANAETRTLYLELPYSESSTSAMAGHKTIYCGAGSASGGLRPPSSNYNVCASEFFVPFNAYSNQRVLQLQLVDQALQESGFLSVMEQFLVARNTREAEEARAAYRAAFENAKTLEAIKAFEDKYQGNDPEGFIGQLSLGKRTLEVEEYRRRYAALQTTKDLQAFLTDYASDDPDGRLPEVRQRLEGEQRKAVAEAKRAQDLKAAEANDKARQEAERQIRWCRGETVRARQAIGMRSANPSCA